MCFHRDEVFAKLFYFEFMPRCDGGIPRRRQEMPQAIGIIRSIRYDVSIGSEKVKGMCELYEWTPPHCSSNPEAPTLFSCHSRSLFLRLSFRTFIFRFHHQLSCHLHRHLLLHMVPSKPAGCGGLDDRQATGRKRKAGRGYHKSLCPTTLRSPSEGWG